MKLEFVNAQEMHDQHPSTFYAPSQEELSSLEKGDYVKICAENERFWVQIREVNGSDIQGVIDNDLVNTHKHGLKDTDLITFHSDNVFQILPQD